MAESPGPGPFGLAESPGPGPFGLAESPGEADLSPCPLCPPPRLPRPRPPPRLRRPPSSAISSSLSSSSSTNSSAPNRAAGAPPPDAAAATALRVRCFRFLRLYLSYAPRSASPSSAASPSLDAPPNRVAIDVPTPPSVTERDIVAIAPHATTHAAPTAIAARRPNTHRRVAGSSTPRRNSADSSSTDVSRAREYRTRTMIDDSSFARQRVPSPARRSRRTSGRARHGPGRDSLAEGVTDESRLVVCHACGPRTSSTPVGFRVTRRAPLSVLINTHAGSIRSYNSY